MIGYDQETGFSAAESHSLIIALCEKLRHGAGANADGVTTKSTPDLLLISNAALHMFLRANVTGPILQSDFVSSIKNAFGKQWQKGEAQITMHQALKQLQKGCLRYLEIDGSTPYAYIEYLELFCLAKYALSLIPDQDKDIVELPSLPATEGSSKQSLAWARFRLDVWHYKLITQPSLSHGSNFTRSSQWSDVPSLISRIYDGIVKAKQSVIEDDVWADESSRPWSRTDRVLFFLEAANALILLGQHDKAKGTLREATLYSGLTYALSGALGKRTKFQEKDISQLVVLAKSFSDDAFESAHFDEEDAAEARPEQVKLNHDTLLEEISYAKKTKNGDHVSGKIPDDLSNLSPDEQPQLLPLDQIILLTEATIKDTFSPVDTLTSEEILPYALRVIADKSTNWQIYTQALLVRSRIEVHRSKTVERGVLQLQAVADQVLTDTTASVEEASKMGEAEAEDISRTAIPDISITTADKSSISLPTLPQRTSFLPAIKQSESASASLRLKYIHALSSPPKWHLESELAHAWASIGSLTSALEIFKQLRLWAEVALCLATIDMAKDEDGRGSGGEAKAKAIIRWRLFHKTGDSVSEASDPDDEDVGEDVTSLKEKMFCGPERSPPPPNASRLWCILGELEDNPLHYVRAWEISSGRYARAQKLLGEYCIRKKDLEKAKNAFELATSVNRLSPELWSRLGDLSLRLGNFEEAANAFNRCISSANDAEGGEEARTWSNLGSALWSLYLEKSAKNDQNPVPNQPAGKNLDNIEEEDDDDDDDRDTDPKTKDVLTPRNILSQALVAYKKGASIAHSNWRIWDNVLTISTRVSPPAISDMILAMTHILHIRKTETCLDASILSALLTDVVLTAMKITPSAAGVYDPPRGSPERLVTRLFEEEIVPVITYRAELWALISKLRGWRRDFAGAVDASERAWRATYGGAPANLSSPDTSVDGEVKLEVKDWATDKEAWDEMVKRTDELVSVLENWGPQTDLGSKWKGKARSALRSVMGKGKEMWEGNEGWAILERLVEELRAG